MSQETNEFENGPMGEADSDSLQSPPSPDQDELFEDFKPETNEEANADFSGQAPPAPVVGPRRLVRDPYSRLGGVASGVAHYYGVDVVLVRLLFVAFVLFTGFGVLLYFLAWLIIPRAEYWPPTPPKGGTRAGLDNRQVALGLVGFGVLVAAFATGGAGSQVVIALGLIGAGVWMFSQSPEPATLASPAGPVPPDTAVARAGVGAVGGEVHPDDGTEPFVSGFSGAGDPPSAPPPIGSEPVGFPPPQPVERSRRRIWPLIVFPFLFLILPLIFAAMVFLLVVFSDNGSIEISGDGVDDRSIQIVSVDQLLEPINHDIGSLTLDLTALEADDFADYETPIEVDVSSDLGEIKVVLPDDLDVRVQADVDLGEIDALGRTVEGVSPSLSTGTGDAMVEFDLDLDIGLIEVRRVAS